MDNKLSELSKPVAWVKAGRNIAENWSCTDPEAVISTDGWHSDYNPTYSQEYVSALLARIEELEKKETWRERQSVIDGLAGAGEAWSDIEEYMVKWDEERRNG